MLTHLTLASCLGMTRLTLCFNGTPPGLKFSVHLCLSCPSATDESKEATAFKNFLQERRDVVNIRNKKL